MTTPYNKYPVETETEAYDLYIHSALKNDEISEKLNIPIDTLSYWISSNGWKTKKDDLKKEAMESTDEHFRQLVRTSRIDTLKRHMEVSKELEKRILDRLTKKSPTGRPVDISDNDLMKLAQALKSSTDVSARAAGISDRTFDNASVLPIGTSPVLVVGLQPQKLPESKISTPVDITTEVEISKSDPF
jgi:hypothetical protein